MISRLKALVKKHYLATILAITAGLIMLGPQLVFMWLLGSEYHGIYMMGSDAEPHYVARMQELYDGNGVGNAYYFENKNDVPNIYFSYSEKIIAIPGLLLGISANKLNLIYKFIFPAVVYLLIYFLLYRLTNRRMWSLVGASLIVMGNLMFSVPHVLNLLKFNLAYTQFSIYSRPVNPEFISIVFFTYLHLLLSAISSGRRIWYIIAGLLFGLTFYLYFYCWTFILALNFCLALIFNLRKDSRTASLNIILTTIAGFILGWRAIIELIAVKTNPYIHDLAGIYDVASRRPVISTAGLIIVLFFTWYLWTKYFREKEDFFILGLLTAAFVDVNQQIITGLSVQTGHYHWYFNTPIFMIIFAYLGAKWLNNIFPNYFLRAISILVIVVSISSSLFVQYSSYTYGKGLAVSQQNYAEVFNWINLNTPRNSVFLARQPISELIPAYTSANVLENSYGNYYILSPERRAFTNDVAIKFLRSSKKLPFRLDYIIWDTEADPNWKIDKIKIAKEEVVMGHIRIYSLSKN